MITVLKEGWQYFKVLMACHRPSESTGETSHLVKTCAIKELPEEELQKIRCGKLCFESAPSRWDIHTKSVLNKYSQTALAIVVFHNVVGVCLCGGDNINSSPVCLLSGYCSTC